MIGDTQYLAAQDEPTFRNRPLSGLAVRDRPSIDPAKYRNEEFDLFSIPAYDQGEPECLSGFNIGSTKKVVLPGDVLVSRIVPHIQRVWVVPRSRGRRQIASGEWIIFRGEDVVPEYLRHVFLTKQFHTQFMSTVAGVGGSLLRARPREVERIKIPLPNSKNEQRRIAAILDKADSIRHKYKHALTLTDELVTRSFEQISTAHAREAKRMQLGDVAMPSRNSFTNGPFGSNLLTSELTSVGVPVVYIRDIRDGRYERVSKSCVTVEKAAELNACAVHPGDVLIAKVGDPPGTAAVYPAHEPKAIVTQDVIRLRVDPAKAVPEYIAHMLNSRYGKHVISSITVEATRARFGLGQLKDTAFEILPIKWQQEFAAVSRHASRLRDSLTFEAVTADDLFASLTQRAFRGEL